jgi:phospholipid/cholesterol/gamma-HCH transport system substrate-binding protein
MTRQARVGLLVIAGAALFIIVLFTIAQRSFLLSDTFRVQTSFFNVSGLTPGAPVQYQGVNVGRVEAVILPSQSSGKVRVEMQLEEDVEHLIRTNTQAQVQSDGLVGNMIVVLLANSAQAPQVEPGGEIPGLEPFSLTDVTDRALTSVEAFNEVAEGLQLILSDVRNAEGTIGSLIYDPALYNSLVATTTETEALLGRLGQSAENIVLVAENATSSVDTLLNKINNGDGSLALMLNDPGLYNRLLAASDTLLAVTEDVSFVTTNLEEATAWGAIAAFRAAELTEALKTNFLFKRYFEERGFSEQAPFEIRERAIRSSQREIEEQRRALYEWQLRLEALVERLEAGGVAPPAAPDVLPEPRALPTPAPDVRPDETAESPSPAGTSGGDEGSRIPQRPAPRR